MPDGHRTAALVSAVGGAGATRLALETAGVLAADGRDVAIVDAAFATPGLARYVAGSIDPDLTAVLAGDADPAGADHDRVDLADALVDLPVDAPGRLAVAPARAPFERLARAKTAGAAERLDAAVATAAERFDHVLVDAPPVAANQAVAAVTGVDRVGVVAPADRRGADALPRVRGRVADVGATVDLVVANRADGGHPVESADVTVPLDDQRPVEALPACVRAPDDAFAPAVATLAAALLDATLAVDFDAGGLLGFDAGRVLSELVS